MRNPVPSAAIRAELARTGTEQKDVAAWLGYQPSQITKRMRGEVEWRLNELQIIAEKLGVPVATLIDEHTPADDAGSAVSA